MGPGRRRVCPRPARKNLRRRWLFLTLGGTGALITDAWVRGSALVASGALWDPAISVVAGATGAVVAMAGDAIRRRRRRPNLVLHPFEVARGDGIVLQHRDGSGSAWLRMRVENTGREAARAAEIAIERISELGSGHRQLERAKRFSPQQPEAAIGRLLKWADQDAGTVDIPSHATRRFDVVHIVSSEPHVQTEHGLEVPLRVGFARESGAARERLSGLNYRLELSLSGTNFESVVYEISLDFGGVWVPGEAIWSAEKGGLKVSLPRVVHRAG
jgi:hypothetical protein